MTDKFRNALSPDSIFFISPLVMELRAQEPPKFPYVPTETFTQFVERVTHQQLSHSESLDSRCTSALTAISNFRDDQPSRPRGPRNSQTGFPNAFSHGTPHFHKHATPNTRYLTHTDTSTHTMPSPTAAESAVSVPTILQPLIQHLLFQHLLLQHLPTPAFSAPQELVPTPPNPFGTDTTPLVRTATAAFATAPPHTFISAHLSPANTPPTRAYSSRLLTYTTFIITAIVLTFALAIAFTCLSTFSLTATTTTPRTTPSDFPLVTPHLIITPRPLESVVPCHLMTNYYTTHNNTTPVTSPHAPKHTAFLTPPLHSSMGPVVLTAFLAPPLHCSMTLVVLTALAHAHATTRNEHEPRRLHAYLLPPATRRPAAHATHSQGHRPKSRALAHKHIPLARSAHTATRGTPAIGPLGPPHTMFALSALVVSLPSRLR